jgi:hypothetical protein
LKVIFILQPWTMVDDDDVWLVESIGGIMLKLKCNNLQLYKYKL